MDLFDSHLMLTSLLEASTSIVAGVPPDPVLARRLIDEADLRWVQVLRKHWPHGDVDGKQAAAKLLGLRKQES